MIIEIAIGVCLGIVLAVVILKHWRTILSGNMAGILWFALIGLLLFAASFVWKHISALLIYGGALFSVLVLYGIPFYVYKHVVQRYPVVAGMVRGNPPWNAVKFIGVRLMCLALLALSVAALGVGGLLGGVWLVDLITQAVFTFGDA